MRFISPRDLARMSWYHRWQYDEALRHLLEEQEPALVESDDPAGVRSRAAQILASIPGDPAAEHHLRVLDAEIASRDMAVRTRKAAS